MLRARADIAVLYDELAIVRPIAPYLGWVPRLAQRLWHHPTYWRWRTRFGSRCIGRQQPQAGSGHLPARGFWRGEFGRVIADYFRCCTGA